MPPTSVAGLSCSAAGLSPARSKDAVTSRPARASPPRFVACRSASLWRSVFSMCQRIRRYFGPSIELSAGQLQEGRVKVELASVDAADLAGPGQLGEPDAFL